MPRRSRRRPARHGHDAFWLRRGSIRRRRQAPAREAPLSSRNGSAASPPPQRKPTYGPRGSPCCRCRRGLLQTGGYAGGSDEAAAGLQRAVPVALGKRNPERGDHQGVARDRSRVIPCLFAGMGGRRCGGGDEEGAGQRRDKSSLGHGGVDPFAGAGRTAPPGDAPRSPPPVLRLWPTGASDVHAAGMNRLGSLALRF
jgi:hypothetical protein